MDDVIKEKSNLKYYSCKANSNVTFGIMKNRLTEILNEENIRKREEHNDVSSESNKVTKVQIKKNP